MNMDFQTVERLMNEAKAIYPPKHLFDRRDEGKLNTYYQFFGHFAANVGEPGVFLEIGVQHGGTAVHVVDMAKQHVYIGVDHNLVEKPIPQERTVVIRGDSIDPAIVDTVKAMANFNGGIFAVFQDSSHHYYESTREWELYSPLLREGGVWFCDDITPAFRLPTEEKGMVEYFQELPGEKRLYDDLHFGSMIGVVLK